MRLLGRHAGQIRRTQDVRERLGGGRQGSGCNHIKSALNQTTSESIRDPHIRIVLVFRLVLLGSVGLRHSRCLLGLVGYLLLEQLAGVAPGRGLEHPRGTAVPGRCGVRKRSRVSADAVRSLSVVLLVAVLLVRGRLGDDILLGDLVASGRLISGLELLRVGGGSCRVGSGSLAAVRAYGGPGRERGGEFS